MEGSSLHLQGQLHKVKVVVDLVGFEVAVPRNRGIPAMAEKATRDRAAAARVTADRQGLVDQFAKVHGRLGHALGVIEEGETREAVLKVAGRRAKKAFEDFTAKSARFLEAGLDLAGLDDLVGIVRPGVGRRGRPAGKTQIDPRVPMATADGPEKSLDRSRRLQWTGKLLGGVRRPAGRTQYGPKLFKATGSSGTSTTRSTSLRLGAATRTRS